MLSDSKIIIPQSEKGKWINSAVGVPYSGTPISAGIRLNEINASIARLQASLAAIEAAGATIDRLLVSYDGSTPVIESDTYIGCTVTKPDSVHIRVTSLAKWTSTPFVLSTNLNVGWIKEDSSNILFELPEDYSGNPFTIKIWEESI